MTQVSHSDAHQIAVNVVYTNLTDHSLKQLEFNVLNSLNTRLIRPVCDMWWYRIFVGLLFVLLQCVIFMVTARTKTA